MGNEVKSHQEVQEMLMKWPLQVKAGSKIQTWIYKDPETWATDGWEKMCYLTADIRRPEWLYQY